MLNFYFPMQKERIFMENPVIKSLLIEYERKRRTAISDLEERKNSIFSSCPELEIINKDIAKLSIRNSISILNSSQSEKEQILLNYKKDLANLNKKKISLLKKLGKTETFFEPNFECKLCNDTGFISKDSKSIMCSCLKQKLYDIEFNKSNLGNLEYQNFDNFNLMKYTDEINKEKYHSELSPRDNISKIKEICEHFIVNFDDPNEKNLLFTGNTGLGKTFLSSCIANELLKKGKTVLYQTAPVMLETIIDYRFNKPNCNFNIIDNLLTVDLLIIDDLGTETMNNMKFTELFNIINSRLLNQNNKITKTIISTNLSLKNIFDTYEERLGSRFVGHYNICRFFGDDIRFKKEFITK